MRYSSFYMQVVPVTLLSLLLTACATWIYDKDYGYDIKKEESGYEYPTDAEYFEYAYTVCKGDSAGSETEQELLDKYIGCMRRYGIRASYQYQIPTKE